MEETAARLRVTLRYFDGCPNWQTTLPRLQEVLAELGHPEVEVSLERVDTDEEAQRLRFVGSPTVLLDGRDPFEEAAGGYGLACRVYRTPEGPVGSPTKEQLRDMVSAYVNGQATS